MALLRSRCYIFVLDRVKLFLGIFIILSCLMESLLHHLSGSTVIFVKNTHQKAANLAFPLMLAAGMVQIENFEVESNPIQSKSRDVSLLSVVWAIGHISLCIKKISLPFWWSFKPLYILGLKGLCLRLLLL